METYRAFFICFFLEVCYTTNMKQFTYVEDYIEVIAGVRDVNTDKLISLWGIHSVNPIVNLARYDVKVLESMTDTVTSKLPLTERQGELAVKIILKYERQLTQKGVSVEPVKKPIWRIALRKMDYSRRLYMQDDRLILKFPFDNDLITSIRSFSKESQGSVKWEREKKYWDIGLTEYNLSWVHTWSQANKFDIDGEVNELMNLITEVERQNDSLIELCLVDDRPHIKNAPESLVTYIENTLGGFDVDNLLKLVDFAPVLGYTVDSNLASALVAEYGPRFHNLLVNRETKVNPSTVLTTDNFASVLDYADSMQRWPVVIYEPDLSNRLLGKLEELRPGLYYSNGSFKMPTFDSAVRYIHTVVPIRSIDVIPLVVSSAGMVFGGDKQVMLQRAEKVVYCAADVYNKKQKTKVKDIAS
jgi:hypothetical protein